MVHCELDVASLQLEASASASSTTEPLLPFCLRMEDPYQEFPLQWSLQHMCPLMREKYSQQIGLQRPIDTKNPRILENL